MTYPSEQPSIVIGYDGDHFVQSAKLDFQHRGYHVVVASSPEDLIDRVSSHPPSMILLDIGDGPSGFATLEKLSSINRSVPVIAMSATATLGMAVRATKLGAVDMIANPPDLRQLHIVMDGIITDQTQRERQRDRDRSRGCDGFEMLGESQSMLDVLDLVHDVAETDATVLVLGESGTGKELLARAIHGYSKRKDNQFVPVNVAALPPDIAESILFGHEKGAYTGADHANDGWCETANGGTLMLDEIGEMNILLQAKLLRFLQDGTFMRVGSTRLQTADVRVIAATNRDPEIMVGEQRMREDLYYRLNVFPIRMPPLRERREDIPLLAQAFLDRSVETHHRTVVGFTEDAMDCLISYDWPGNVRQLENLVTRMVLLTREPYIGINSVPCEIKSVTRRGNAPSTSGASGLTQMEQLERQAIIDALVETDGNAVAAARRLGVGQATIYRKIKRFKIQLKKSKPSTKAI